MSMLQKSYNGYVVRATNGVAYLYDSADGDNFGFNEPVANMRNWIRMSGGKGLGAKEDDRSASIAGDIVELSDVFYNTKVPGALTENGQRVTYEDLAKKVLQELAAAKRDKDPDRAGAMITSLDFANFQDVITVGENAESPQFTGILGGLFQSVPLDNWSGLWRTMSSDIKWHNNLAESETPEPSGGKGSTITVNVEKHGGAVGWTDKAQDVINGVNPFTDLVNRLGDARLANENELLAEEIETNTGNTTAGVDFGLRAGTPPVSSNNPLPLLQTIKGLFPISKPWNLTISKGFIFTEYITNDVFNPTSVPPPTITNQNGEVGPMPFASGVTWARDDTMDSLTDMFVMNDSAIKQFRKALVQYTVRNQDFETTKVVIKNYYKPKTVDTASVRLITGVAA